MIREITSGLVSLVIVSTPMNGESAHFLMGGHDKPIYGQRGYEPPQLSRAVRTHEDGVLRSDETGVEFVVGGIVHSTIGYGIGGK